MASSKQRREAARRRLQNQLERRQQVEQRRRRTGVIVSAVGVAVILVVVLIFIVATGNDDKKPAATSTTPATATTPATTAPATHAPGSCDFQSAGTAARTVKLPATTVPTKGTVKIQVATTQGPMTFTLNRASAPCTVASFVSLVQQKYYDKTPCHRLVTQGIYVLQCGDPTGTGTGAPGYSIPDEATGAEKYPAGTIAMARTNAAHSGGSQFFIVYKDSPALEQQLGHLQYTVFGTVSSGLDIVTKVAAKGTNNANGAGDGKPKLPVTIDSMKVA